jgi:phosphoserine phosphatase
MHVLTLIAVPSGPLSAPRLSRLRALLRPDHAAWLAPEEAADLFFTSPPDHARIADAIAGAPIDFVLQPAATRAKQLLVADMDSTLVVGETLDDLAAYAGIGEAVAAITSQSMNGTIDFGQALASRVAMLRGLDLGALDHVWSATRLNPGAEALFATMRRHGAVCAIVSGGFTCFTERLAARLGAAHHVANRLEDDGIRLTGKLVPPILDRAGKAATLRALAMHYGLAAAQTMAVGDGANDMDMLRDAGMGIAYHAKPIVARATRFRIDHCDLRALLFIQGHKPVP